MKRTYFSFKSILLVCFCSAFALFLYLLIQISYAIKADYRCIFKSEISRPDYCLSDKSMTIVGSSSMAGNTSQFEQTYYNLFYYIENELGISCTNRSVAGSMLCEQKRRTRYIDQLKKAKIDTDILLVGAIGGNDCEKQKDLSDYEESLVELCDYIDANYNGIVVFMTYHPSVFHNSNDKISINEYRTIAERIASNRGYDYIDGSYIPFPTEKGILSKTLMFDNLHPSIIGYYVFANWFVNMLRKERSK